MQVVEGTDMECMNWGCLEYCQTKDDCYLYCGTQPPVSLLESQEYMEDKE